VVNQTRALYHYTQSAEAKYKSSPHAADFLNLFFFSPRIQTLGLANLSNKR
jgi:hypothetical protein